MLLMWRFCDSGADYSS